MSGEKQASTAAALKSNKTWEELGVDKELSDKLVSKRFETPSKTQELLLQKLKDDPYMSGVCEAPTGSGKTLAYIIAAMKRIKKDKKEPQVVVLAHTQILCIQIQQEFERVCKELGVTTSLCLGMSAGFTLDPTAQVIIATSKALISNFCAKEVRGKKSAALHSAASIQTIIIDEADYFFTDNMLKHEIKDIFKNMNQNAQKLLFSATIDKEVKTQMVEEWFGGRDIFTVCNDIVLDNTIHLTYNASGKGTTGKLEMVEKVFDLDVYDEGFKAIVFCKTRNSVDDVHRRVTEMQYECARYHSDMTPEEKERQYNDFSSGKKKVLITTDVMARGIDIITISLVVNYDLPTVRNAAGQDVVSPTTYVHRTGRAGRFGRKCVALSILDCQSALDDMKKVQAHVDKHFREGLFSEVTTDTLEVKVKEQMKEEKADVEVETEKADAIAKKMSEADKTKEKMFQKKAEKKPAEAEKKPAENPEIDFL